MSLTILKAAFESSAAGMLSPDDRADLWQRMVAYMVNDVGGRTLYWHVPMIVPDITQKRRQGDLFEMLLAQGKTQREIAREAGSSQSTVHRHLSLIQPRAVSESAA